MKTIIFVAVIMIGLGLGCTRFQKPISTLEPYSFTFDFTSAPDPLNSGGDGDDWLFAADNGVGFTSGAQVYNTSYNQEVGGRVGVVKYTRIPGSPERGGLWYATAPEAHTGESWYKELGRVNSFPDNYKDYSTWRLRTDIYLSGLNEAASTFRSGGLRAGLGIFGSQDYIRFVEDGLSPSSYDIVEDQWVTWDTGEQTLDPSTFQFPPEGNWFRLYIDRRSGEDEFIFNTDQSVIALDNFTISFTP